MRLYSLVAAIMLLLLGITGARAQYGIYNGDFSIRHNAMASNGCPYITSHYLPNWIASHGTPDTAYGGIHIWYDGNSNWLAGEGIAGGYHFEPGMTYEVSVRVLAYPLSNGAVASGPIYIYAATGIVEDSPGALCGEVVPAYMGTPTASAYTGTNPDGNACGKELIGVQNVTNTQYLTYTFNYTPTTPSEQIWLYPYLQGPVRTELAIEWVRIKACTNGSSITITTPISPAGATHYATITAGGGTGSVLVNATPFQNTAYIGPNINLVPNFSAVFSGSNNHYFLALAIPDCGDTTSTGGASRPAGEAQAQQPLPVYDEHTLIGADGETRLPAPVLDAAMPANGLQIAPNPARDYIQVMLPQIEGAAVLTLSNADGKVIFTSTLEASWSARPFRVNTAAYAKGLYSVRVVTGKGTFSGKVVKL